VHPETVFKFQIVFYTLERTSYLADAITRQNLAWYAAMFWLLIAHAVLLPWAIRNLLRVPRNPTEALSWIYFIVFVPILGPLSYIVLGERFFRTKPIPLWPPGIDSIRAPNPTDILNIAAELAGSVVTTGERFHITADPKQSLQLIRDKLEAARHTIYVEFYIIENDAIGTEILDILIRKAREGLRIYLIYDWFGSYFINQSKVRELQRSGRQRLVVFTHF
jgi:cardiolipin synthase A/B